MINFSRNFSALVLTFFLASCASRTQTTSLSSSKELLAISSSEVMAARAAEEVFEDGGNIADAFVAASFAISVIRQQSTGIGGGGFLVGRVNDKLMAWDFRERAPGLAKRDMYLKDGKAQKDLSKTGALAVGVPGLVKGLFEFHKEHGVLPWQDVLSPAIRLAKEGSPVSAHLERAIAQKKETLLKDETLSRIFVPNGKGLRKGQKFKQPELANTLIQLAEKGPQYFYEGDFASKMESFMKKEGGFVRRKDLLSFQVKRREPVKGNWRNYSIVSMPPPSSGGIHLIQILQMVDLIKAELPVEIKEIESFKRAYADRAVHLGDPDFIAIPRKDLLDPSYLKKRVADVSMQNLIPSSEISAGSFPGFKGEPTETTHLSLMDSQGNMISSTQSVNGWFGAGITLPGTGVVLNNTMDDFSVQPGVANLFGLLGGEANSIAARKTPLSSMTPTLVFDQSGEPVAAIGAPGGSKIITSVYVGVSRWLRDGMPPHQALAACRIHHQWSPDKVYLESKGCDRESEILKNKYTIEVSDNVGELQLVGIDLDGKMFATADPRGAGRGFIFERLEKGSGDTSAIGGY